MEENKKNNDSKPVEKNIAQENVPYATSVLVLGICSIVTCFCYGLPGLICSIIALVQAKKGKLAYENNPNLYKESSFGNLKAGRICGIIGLVLNAVYFVFILVYIIFFGMVAALGTFPNF